MKELTNKIKARILFTELNFFKNIPLKDILKFANENKGWEYRHLEKIVEKKLEEQERKKRRELEIEKKLENLPISTRNELNTYIQSFEDFKKNLRLKGKKRRNAINHFKIKNLKMYKLKVSIYNNKNW